jgi:phospholipid/cholesterol/gamma-HCH transport system substrate-binding protein/paraquat-inducible protein B
MVKVAFNMNPGLITGMEDQDPEEARRFLESEINRGLRVYLSFQGISGITYLNLDYLNEPAPATSNNQSAPAQASSQNNSFMEQETIHVFPVLPGDTALIIPSVPSSILEIGESMTQIVRTFREIDFKTLVDRSTLLVTNLEQLSAQLNRESGGFTEMLLGAITDTQTAANEVTALARSINTEFSAFMHGTQLKELELTLADTRRTLNRLDALLKSPQATLPTTLDNLRVMSENLREFSELARSYPSQIFLGGPPPVDR